MTVARAIVAVVLLCCAACFNAELPRVSPRPPVGTPVGTGESGLESPSCEAVEKTKDLGADHLEPGDTYDYPEYPPASGPHAEVPLEAGVFDEPLSKAPAGSKEATIFRAVHSLEHGYVIVFHKDLPGSRVAALTEEFGDTRKVIIVPEPAIDGKVLLVAWLRKQSCSELDLGAVAAFIKQFREKTAPEPNAA